MKSKRSQICSSCERQIDCLTTPSCQLQNAGELFNTTLLSKKKANKSFICARDPGRGFAWIDAALTCSHINNYIVNEKHELTTSAKDVFNIVKFAIRRRENFQLGGNGWNEQTWVVKLCVDVHATNSNFPLSDGELKSSCYGKVFLAKRKSLAIRTIKLAFHG